MCTLYDLYESKGEAHITPGAYIECVYRYLVVALFLDTKSGLCQGVNHEIEIGCKAFGVRLRRKGSADSTRKISCDKRFPAQST